MGMEINGVGDCPFYGSNLETISNLFKQCSY